MLCLHAGELRSSQFVHAWFGVIRLAECAVHGMPMAPVERAEEKGEYLVQEIDLTGACDYGEQYLRMIDEAANAEEPDDTRMCIGDALMVGQSVLDLLEDGIAKQTEVEHLDRLEASLHQFILSMDTAEQAIEISDDDLCDLVAEMRRYAERAMDMLGSASRTPIS